MYRVPVTGGTPQQVNSDLDWYIVAVGASELYVSYPAGTRPPYPQRIVTMDANGATLQTLVDNLPQYDSPNGGAVLDRGELFWLGTYSNGILFKMPVSGGTPTSIGSIWYDAFGVTADSIVYGFTTSGYSTIPR